MPSRSPAREVPSTLFRRNLGDVVGRAEHAGERAVITRGGKRVCAVVPIADLEKLEAQEKIEADQNEARERWAFRMGMGQVNAF